MSWSTGSRSSWAVSVAVGALALCAACGDDDAKQDSGPTSTTSSTTDTTWFEVAPVTAVQDAPCTSGATPSQDGLQCYQLGGAVFDAAGVEEATAVEDEAPLCEIPPGQEICIETGLSSTTTGPKPGTWSVPFALTDSALQSFNGLADACIVMGSTCPTGQVAIVIDDVVITAPTIQATDFERDAFVVSGAFDQEAAESIAARLSA